MNGKQKFITLLVAFQFVILVSVYFSVNFLSSTFALPADPTYADATGMASAFMALSAGLAVGLTGIAAGIAIKTAGTAAISTLTENEGAFFKGFLVVALGEAIAVYGLIIGILLWTKIPNFI